MKHSLISLALLALTAHSAAAEDTNLNFQRCQIEKGAIIVDAECAVLSRPENPAAPAGKQIELFIAKFPSRAPQPEADALTIIQGGPGMSSIDLYLNMRGVFAGMRAKRDILIVDQRGTGRSNMLTCPQHDDLSYRAFDPKIVAAVTSECLAQLDADPRFYTTSVAVSDLEAVRSAAGYEQLSIYGVSYGTRVAQQYLRSYPAATRAVILDGVADIELNLAGGEIARRSQQAFDRMVSRCNADSHCQSQFGDLEKKFTTVRARLNQSPVEVKLAHPISGAQIKETFTEQHLLGLVRLMPYSTESLALLPLLLAQAHAGDFRALAAQAILSEQQFTDDYAYAMNNSVVCTEDEPFLTAADFTGQEQTFFGADVSASIQTVCSLWPRGPLSADFRKPFHSTVPTLLMSGQNDPITPPANADRALQMFANGLHVSVPAHGHGVISRGCLPQLAEIFIKQASVEELDLACVEREQAVPFFITPAGPTP